MTQKNCATLSRMRGATLSTPTELKKEDNNEFCLIKVRRQAPKAGRQAFQASRHRRQAGGQRQTSTNIKKNTQTPTPNAGALPRVSSQKKAVERPSCGRDSCDEKKIEKNSPKKQKLTGSSPRTHEASALEASSNRNCRYVRPSPDLPDGARRQRLVCPGTRQAQRAEILPFRNASSRFLSQR